MSDVTLMVFTLDCFSCVESVQEALGGLPSVEVTQPEQGKRFLQVRFDKAVTTLEAIRGELQKIGFSEAQQDPPAHGEWLGADAEAKRTA